MSKPLRAFLSNRVAVVSAVVLALIVAAALLAPVLPIPDPADQDLMASLLPPSLDYPLGTDEFGRDLFTRIIYGARLALTISLLSVLGALAAGSLVGVLAAYIGGLLDTLLMRTMDILLAFPYLLIAIAIVTALGPGALNAAFAIGLWLMPSAARVARGAVLEIKEREFVEGARALGARGPRIVTRHIVPNILSALVVFATVAIGRAIIMDAALSFLGLGAQPPTPSWGNMVSDGRTYLLVAPHIALLPGVAILITVLAFNTLGDGIKEAANPRARR